MHADLSLPISLRGKHCRGRGCVRPSIENAVKSVNEKADGYLLKPVNIAEMLEMIKKILTEKTNEYVQMIKMVEQAKESTPLTKYQNPERWRG